MTGSQPARFDASPARKTFPWILGLLTLLAPFAFAPFLADPFELPKQVVIRLGALLLIGIGWWQIRSPGELRVSRGGTTIPVLLLSFISLLSIFQAMNRPAATAVARDATLLIIVFLLSGSVLSPARARIPAGCLGLAAGATALLGSLQFLLGPRLTWLPSTQGGALVGDVGAAALLVAAGLPVLIGFSLSSSGRLRRVWAGGTGLAIGYLVLSRSRPAWLGALVGLLLFGLLRRAERRRNRAEVEHPISWRGISILAAGVALVLVLAGTWWIGISLLSNPPSLRTSDLLGWELRWDSWRTTLNLILTHPLGSGAGNWREAFTARAGNMIPATRFVPGRLPVQASSEYLQIGAELGAAGLFLLLWALYRILRVGMSASRAEGGWAVIPATAGLGALAAAGLLACPLRDPATLWTATLLSILIVSSETEKSGDPERRTGTSGKNLRPYLLATSGVLVLALISLSAWSSARALSASVELKSGQAAYAREEYGAALPALRRAEELNPASHPTRYLVGVCARAAGQLNLAEKELLAAREMNPGDPLTLIALSSTLREEGKLIDAVAMIEKALRFWPHDETVNLRAGDLREATGNRKGAFEAYRDATAANPSSVEAYMRLGDLLLARGESFTAVGAYLKAANLDPYDPKAVSSLAAAYFKGGEYQSAVQVYQSLLSLAPEDVLAMLNLARTYSGLGRNCDALSMLQRARGIAKDPAQLAAIDAGIQNQSAKCAKNPRAGT